MEKHSTAALCDKNQLETTMRELLKITTNKSTSCIFSFFFTILLNKNLCIQKNTISL